MEIADNLLLGLSVALSWSNLWWCLVGVMLGSFVGVMPGIGSMAAIALLLPFILGMDATAAIIMLAGVYYGATYGGATASILLNLPGTPTSAVTCLDGYPMAQQGRAAVALFMHTVASFFGSCVGIVILMFFAPMIAEIALKFGPAEYAAMIVLGLIAASTISSGNPLKGICMVVLGMLFGIVGTDVNSGIQRYTFGIPELWDGIKLVAVATGIFGLSEVISSVGVIRTGHVDRKSIRLRAMIPTRDDMRRSWGPMLRGSGIGAFFGALPGTGGVLASFMSYAVEKRIASDPSRFGKGAIEGIMGPEASNNAADGTAFIPTLTLGIPGNVVMALIIGAIMIKGIAPGPQLMTEHPNLFWGLIMSFWISNGMLLIVNIPMIGIWVRILAIPYHVLYPAILMFVCMGVYSIDNNAFDVVMVMFFGALGYIMRLLDLSPASMLLGLVLGPMLEEHVRRALLLSRGSFMVFVERPISGFFMAFNLVLLLWALWATLRPRKKSTAGHSRR